MTKHNSIFKLNRMTAMKKLLSWKSDYFHTESVDLKFVNDIMLGEGMMRYYEHSDSADMYIGISPFSISFFDRYMPITDSDFVLMGVTFFHEMAHYQDHISDHTDTNVLISDLSVQYNIDYYHSTHHKLPHEIKAEYRGIMSMWSVLENEYPEHADSLMFDYLNYRTMHSNRTRKLYVIERPDDGFQSKQQVKDLFDDVYEKSLINKRKLPNGFLASSDDASCLIATNDGCAVRTEYVPIYLKLLKAETGAAVDQMMASLVTHIHPDLQNVYVKLKFDELKPDIIFDMPIPETINESRMRLGYGISFADSVNYITKLQDEGHQL